MAEFTKFTNLANEDLVIIPDTSSASSGDVLSYSSPNLDWKTMPDSYSKSETYTKTEVDTALSAKQDSLSLAQIEAISNVSAVSAALSDLEDDLTDMKTESLADPEIMYVYGQDSNGNIANKPLIVATDFIDQSVPAQTPSLIFNRYKETSSEPGADQSFNELTITKTDNNDNQVFINTILPPKPSFIDVGNSTFLKYWNESDGGHIDWKPVKEVPASTSADAGKMLGVDSSGAPAWKNFINATDQIDPTTFPSQTPNITHYKFVMGNPQGEYDADQVHTAIATEVKSANGQNTQTWTGNLLPTFFASGCLQYWLDAKGGHMDWKPVNEVPVSTSAESGKVLMVDSAGSPEWNTNVFIATYHVTPFADILAAKNRGAIIMLNVSPFPTMYGPLLTLYNMSDTFAYFTTVAPGTTSSPSNLWTVEVSTDGTTDTWSSPIVNKCAQLSSTTIDTASSPVMVEGLNNGFGTMSLNRSSFTLIVKVNDGEVINFALEIENSQSCQLTIQKQIGNTITTLKHSVAGGNTLEANKTYQVTAVGNCWTLAEFTA